MRDHLSEAIDGVVYAVLIGAVLAVFVNAITYYVLKHTMRNKKEVRADHCRR